MTSHLPADASMPQLDILWNADAMQEIFRKRLQNEWGGGVMSCKLSRFRYRAGFRSVVLYEITHRKADGSEPSQHWVTAFTYAQKSVAKQYQRLSKQLRCDVEAELAQKSPIYLQNMNTILQIFPMDRYIPQLQEFLHSIPDHIMGRLLTAFGPGSWKLLSCKTKPSRYRPGYCATLCCEVSAVSDGGKSKNSSFYIKLYRQGVANIAYQHLKQVHLQHDSAEDGFNLLRPLTWCPQSDAIVFGKVPGTSLEEYLRRPSDLPKTMGNIAKSLFCLHSSSIRPPSSRFASSMTKRNQRAIDFIAWACPELGLKLTEIGNLIDRFDILIDPTPAHCDLKAEHIFIDENTVSLIDIDSMAMADPVYDPAMLVVRLNMLAAQKGYSEALLKIATESLLNTYFDEAPISWKRRLPINLASAGLKVALFFVQHQSPNWRKNTRRLINDSYQILTSGNAIVPGQDLA